MTARIVCPHCKSHGRLIRLAPAENDRLKCRHCNRTYTREEIVLIYENAAKAFSEAAAKVRGSIMIAGNEFAMSKGVRYPRPNENTPTNGALALGFAVGIVFLGFLVFCAKAMGVM